MRIFSGNVCGMEDLDQTARLSEEPPKASRIQEALSQRELPGSPNTVSNIDIALRRYDTVFRYLATEHQMSWTKNQFFLAANAGLFAFLSSRFPQDTAWPSLLGPCVMAIIGLFFSILWLLTLRRAAKYVDHWKAICLQLEPTAFGPYQVLRSVPSTRKGILARTIAAVFILLWTVAVLTFAIIFIWR